MTLSYYIFWQSREIYLNSMGKFVAEKWTGSEFVSTFDFLLLSDKRKASLLEKDFEKQKTVELNPEIFRFMFK